MSKSGETTIEVKLFVDKEKRKVLFAESDKEFVDVLFSFLTMPIGTIVRLLGKQSQIGCLDEIYKSIECLSPDYFETKAGKGMLLVPHNAASNHCARLKINVDGTKSSEVYVCKDINCCANADKAFSSVPDSVCKCGKVMESFGQSPSQNVTSDCATGSKVGVFVEGCTKFIITDDLQVAPASTSFMLSLFEKLGVRDPANLEQEFLQLSSEKITRLLKRALTSKQPLTGFYFDVPVEHDEDASLRMLPRNLYPGQVKEVEDALDNLKIRVLQMKNNYALLYAEVGGDFVDFLFGLLSVPLGSILKSFGQCPSDGCVYNLYRSIVDGNAIRPECQSFLLAPKMAPFFGCCASKLLQVDELAPKGLKINACFACFKIGGFSGLSYCQSSSYNYSQKRYAPNCQENVKSIELREINPKSALGGKDGKAYVKNGHMKFVVTDGLNVQPLSLSSTLQVVSEAKMETKDLVEKEINLTTDQILELQRSVLMSRNALSSVLLPPKTKKKNLNHLIY